jgi:osmotically-inducible protein OsmY
MIFKPQTFHQIPPQIELDNTADAQLEVAVADALGRAGLVDATRVSVTTRDAVVILDGFVGSPLEVEAAGEVAARVEGISRVDNRLQVQGAVV